jgi:tetratricopeptide (TPR) repeat protein
MEYPRDRTAGLRFKLGSNLQFGLWRIFLGALVGFPFLAMMALGGETNSLTTNPNPAMRPSLPTPQELAVAHERAGRKREAALLYEEMARTNSAVRKVLSHRLVTLYTETGEKNKALHWAHEAMRNNPDPQAYLAAVHGQLGQWKKAREILEREIAGSTNATRAVTLRWQLADVYEKGGEGLKAKGILNEAAEAVKGTAMESAAQRRLQTLKEPAK